MVYSVVVTEIQRMTIEVEANSSEEATQRAEEIHEEGLLDMDESEDREWNCVCTEEYTCPRCGGHMIPHYDDDEPGEDHWWYPDTLVCSDCEYEA
jgi:hypothetical protein